MSNLSSLLDVQTGGDYQSDIEANNLPTTPYDEYHPHPPTYRGALATLGELKSKPGAVTEPKSSSSSYVKYASARGYSGGMSGGEKREEREKERDKGLKQL